MKAITWTVEKFELEIKSDMMDSMLYKTDSSIKEEAVRRFKLHVENVKKRASSVVVEETETSLTHYNN